MIKVYFDSYQNTCFGIRSSVFDLDIKGIINSGIISNNRNN